MRSFTELYPQTRSSNCSVHSVAKNKQRYLNLNHASGPYTEYIRGLVDSLRHITQIEILDILHSLKVQIWQSISWAFELVVCVNRMRASNSFCQELHPLSRAFRRRLNFPRKNQVKLSVCKDTVSYTYSDISSHCLCLLLLMQNKRYANTRYCFVHQLSFYNIL